MPKKSFVTCTDLFCGAGGSSLGVLQSGGEVSMAVNHWKLAVETHAANFPRTEHDCNDVAASHPARYPSTDILIASPECTNHSIAKGQKRARYASNLFGEQLIDPAAERSRATMWDVPRFAEYHRYALIIVENVIDARAWVLWDAWLQAMHALGYEHRAVYLNSLVCHPTPQSRDRLYVVFWRKGSTAPNLDITPPCRCARCGEVAGVQTWKRGDRRWGRYGRNGQYVYSCPTCAGECHPYYVPALCAIDWALPITRIGDRKVPLKEKTLDRIRLGLERFKGRDLMTDILYSHAHGNRSHPVDGPWPTQTGQQSLALIGANRTNGVPHPVTEPTQGVNTGNHLFVVKLRGDNVGHAIDDPLSTVSAGGKHHAVLAGPPFLTRHYSQAGDASHLSRPVDEPTGAITSSDHHSLTVPPFVTSYYGTDDGHPIDAPLPTVPTVDRHALVQPFVAELFGNTYARSLDAPLTTVVAAGVRHGLVAPFLVSQYGGEKRNPVRSVGDSLPTVPGMALHSLAQPGETPSVEECGFRMLEPHEIQAAMAFPGDYTVLGNKRERIKQLGNAVTPPAMALLIERCLATLG